jgi:hypothetical protein
MLSISRSRFHLPAQLVFLTTNALGTLLGVIYNHQTPDLYEKEKHGPVGWVSTCVASVWFSGSLIMAFAGSRCKSSLVSEHQGQRQGYQAHYDPDDIEEDVEDIENFSLLRRTTVNRFLSRKISRFYGFKRTLQSISITTTVLGRILLPFGFLCITTGAVVYSGIFVSVLTLFSALCRLSSVPKHALILCSKAVAFLTASPTSLRAASSSGMGS